MSQERRFRGGFDGHERPFDWQALARRHGITERDARGLYEEAVHQASVHRDPRRHQEAIYIELLEQARQQTRRPAPGKVTRTMRLQAERAGKQRRRSHTSQLTGLPIAPGKTTLASYIDSAQRPAHGPAHGRNDESRLSEELARLVRKQAEEPEEARADAAMRLSDGPEVAGDMHAFPRGRGRHFRAGAFAPEAPGTDHIIARELAHNVQPRAAVALDRVPGGGRAELEQDLVQHVLAGLDTGRGQPLPPALAERMSRLLRRDFGHVRVHLDDSAAEAAALLGARAFTMGTHIFMGRGQWEPGQAGFERLLVHELTHVVQHDQGRLAPGPAGRVRVATPGDASEREAEAAAARVPASDDETTNATGTAATPTASPAEDARSDIRTETTPRATGAPAQGGVASPDLLPSLSDIVRMVSPGLADLIDQGPLGMIQELIEGGIETFLAPFTSTIESIGGTIDGLVGSFGEVLGFIQGLFSGDPGCCQVFIDGIDRIRSIAQGIAENPAVQALQAGLGQVTSAIQDIAVLVLSPVFDVVKDLLGGAWAGISSLASTISGWLQPILDFSSAAWSWAMEQLGISGGEGGILDWLTGVAGDAWSTIAETLGPVAGPLQAVAGVLVALSPVGPLMLLIQYGPDLVQAVQWLWQNRNNPNIVQRAHEEMGNTFLPGLLDSAQGFGQAMQSAVTWVVDQATGLSTGLLELAGALTGVPLLSLVQGAVQSFSQGATRFSQWATSELSAAVESLQSGFDALRGFVEPYIDVLCSVGMAIVNPGMIPMILAGHAWMALPDCIKGPIIDLLLDAAIVVLDALPSLPLFGPLWAILKSGVLGFLRGLRAQPNEVKEQVSNKIARIISGSSPAFLLGFVKGFLTGVWEGLTDPFVLIWSAVKGLGSVVSWFGDVAQQAMSQTAAARAPADQSSAPAANAPAASAPAAATPAAPVPGQEAGLPTRGELGERVGQMGAELGPPVEQVTGGFWPAVQALFQGGEGLTFEGLIARLGEV